MVRICIFASILATCTGGVFASGTCQSETTAEDVTLLQGRHAVRKHAQPQEDIEEEWLNEEMVAEPPTPPAELPPVPVGYVDTVRDWAAENPSAAAVLRQAIREALIEVVQVRGPDDYRRFVAAFPPANALRQWELSNPDEFGRFGEIVAEISDAEDGGAAFLHHFAATNPGLAAALRGATRERLLHIIFDAARINDTEERLRGATFQIQWWTQRNPYKAQRVFDLVRGFHAEASLLEMAEWPNEEPVLEEGTEGASTPLDFDSEEGPATREQESAVATDGDAPSTELAEECNAHRRTRGTCFFRDCYDWRGVTECVRGRCVCAPGKCSASSPSFGRRGFCADPFEWQRLQRR